MNLLTILKNAKYKRTTNNKDENNPLKAQYYKFGNKNYATQASSVEYCSGHYSEMDR